MHRFFPLLIGTAILLAGPVACDHSAPFDSHAASFDPLKDPDMKPIIHAPELPADFAWLNTDQPLQFAGKLKGQVVVLDFWCYCCINCMHVLPDLERLHEQFHNQPVVIIGVHSNKYDNEADPANIRAAIARYQINHPVIVDQNHRIWDSFDVHAWPTLVLVGADGRIVGGVSGEGHYDLLAKAIQQALDQGRANGSLAAGPLQIAGDGQVRAATGLSFPSKVIPDPANDRLIILDANHNRILITTYPAADGHAKLVATIGSSQTGAADGSFAQATFNRPQGAALAGNTLYVADTENHLIRRVDLQKQTVTTILGTGKQVFDPEAGKTGRDQPLNSPWDVALSGNRLYIAQAGQHQIFAMNLMTGMTEVAAGSGRENILDGPAANANLAQPSGLAIDPASRKLYFADSEVSAIRTLDLAAGQITTLVGHGLFDFGDIDGDFHSARLQHALGVALAPDGHTLFIADTYNHRIKSLDLQTRRVSAIAGTGHPGAGTPGHLEFFEPASLALGKPGELFVADTNNHRIVRFNPENPGATFTELVIENLSPPADGSIDLSKQDKAHDSAIPAGPFAINPAQPLQIKITLKLPPKSHLTPGAPISLELTDGARKLHTATLMPAENTNTITTTIPPQTLNATATAIYLTLYFTHCQDGLNALCTPETTTWKLQLQNTTDPDAAIHLKN